MSMDIEKQAADLRCCGNCSFGKMIRYPNINDVYFGCIIDTTTHNHGCPVSPKAVCDKYQNDNKSIEWRLKHLRDLSAFY